MQDVEQVPSLVGDIYDAALDPSLWPGVLEKAAAFVGGAAAGIWARDRISKALHLYYDFGIDPSYRTLFFEKFEKHIRLAPVPVAFSRLNVGDVVSHSALVPHAEVVETPFYKEWVQPQGFIDNVFARIDKSPTRLASFAVLRHERDGFTDDGARWRMRHLVPHMRRAVLIGLKTAETATFADTLDGLSAAIFLVDDTGRIVHANANGQAMLEARSVLRAAGGKLTAIEANAARALSEIFATADGGDAAVGVKGIAVSLPARDGEHHVAHVLPLTSGTRRRVGAGYAAVAAVFVRKAALDIASPPDTIAKLYKLTPSELRVLSAIVQVGGVPEVAEALDIAETTVKTHLHRLFAKTDTRRQAELVKLVAGFANPVVG